MSVVVVIPSRGRPERAAAAIEAIRATAVRVDTSVVLAVDEDDPTWDEYARIMSQRRFLAGAECQLVTLRGEETGNLVKATNTVSIRIAREDPAAIIGNLGDDQIARTPGWDRMVAESGTHFTYGNDLFQGERLPCGGIFIAAAVVDALGWYALPSCEHLFIDNAWLDLGRAVGITYLPDMIFEHLHPLAGKAKWDAGYERANSQDTVERDRVAYEEWRDEPGWVDGRPTDSGPTDMERDIAAIRHALAVAV